MNDRWPGMLFHTHEKSPCYGCQERTVGCHATCDRHNEWKQDFNDTKDEMLAAKKDRTLVDGFKVESIKRCKR